MTGLILKNYYVTPLCTPSRSALMTGKHPIHTGILYIYIIMRIYSPTFIDILNNLKKTGMQHDVIYGDQQYGINNITFLFYIYII